MEVTNDIEDELSELRRQYADIRRDRAKSQKDEKYLKNKMTLLNKEESKISKKIKLNVSNIENKERIRVNVLKNKEMVDNMKREREAQLEINKKKIKERKDKCETSLSNWRNQLSDHKLKIANLTKSEQKSNENKILKYKQNISNKKKELHDKVIFNLKDSAQKEKKKI